MKDKVSTILQGGMGNYMFQIAVAYAYGLKHNKQPVFNIQESSGVHQNLSTYEENIFSNVELYHTRSGNYHQFNENGFEYNEIPKINGNLLLFGYFQSSKYFEEYREEILKLFVFPLDTYNNILEIISEKLSVPSFFDINTCSIHVRRGDYLKLQDHHPTQNMNYYFNAIKKMPKDSVFLIFSDDIDWCKDNFPDLSEKFVFVEGNKDYEDLFLMSLCKNNIICNSTFSWWSAWLNNNDDKIVVIPKNWFGPAYSNWNTDDLYCENWIKI